MVARTRIPQMSTGNDRNILNPFKKSPFFQMLYFHVLSTLFIPILLYVLSSNRESLEKKYTQQSQHCLFSPFSSSALIQVPSPPPPPLVLRVKPYSKQAVWAWRRAVGLRRRRGEKRGGGRRRQAASQTFLLPSGFEACGATKAIHTTTYILPRNPPPQQPRQPPPTLRGGVDCQSARMKQ